MSNFEWYLLGAGLLFLNISWFALYYEINIKEDNNESEDKGSRKSE